jgi:sugar phosphate isomerase/epimerase
MDSYAAASKPNVGGKTGYEVLILATNWGFNGSIDQFCAAAKKEGYDGVEIWWPMEKKAQDEMFSAVQKHSLQLGVIFGGWQADWKEHLETFRTAISAAAKNTSLRPLYINCHSGKDHFNQETNAPFIEVTNKLSKETGVLICHETHRGRIMFAAHVTMEYLKKYPDLKLTFDVSHWCNVHESMLDDQSAAVDLAIDRTEHIHARIGHAEGPQVNDPRAPEWKSALEKHLGWWDKVAERKKRNGERLTILTEFGPADYMPTLPYTRQAVADQWSINVHMMNLLRKRYQ